MIEEACTCGFFVFLLLDNCRFSFSSKLIQVEAVQMSIKVAQSRNVYISPAVDAVQMIICGEEWCFISFLSKACWNEGCENGEHNLMPKCMISSTFFPAHAHQLVRKCSVKNYVLDCELAITASCKINVTSSPYVTFRVPRFHTTTCECINWAKAVL